jgi:hypothetical protein
LKLTLALKVLYYMKMGLKRKRILEMLDEDVPL